MKKKLFVSLAAFIVACLTAFAAYQHQHKNVYTCLQDDCKKGCTFFQCKYIECGVYEYKCGKCGGFLSNTMVGDQEHDRTLYYAKCNKCSHTSIWAIYYKH